MGGRGGGFWRCNTNEEVLDIARDAQTSKHTEASVAVNGTQQRLVKSASKDEGGEISSD